jgi:hypothetical protein
MDEEKDRVTRGCVCVTARESNEITPNLIGYLKSADPQTLESNRGSRDVRQDLEGISTVTAISRGYLRRLSLQEIWSRPKTLDTPSDGALVSVTDKSVPV